MNQNFVKKSLLRRLLIKALPDTDRSEIYRQAFIEGAKYGYEYHKYTSFPNEPWSTYCKGNAGQKAISQNPFHPLNEIDE